MLGYIRSQPHQRVPTNTHIIALAETSSSRGDTITAENGTIQAVGSGALKGDIIVQSADLLNEAIGGANIALRLNTRGIRDLAWLLATGFAGFVLLAGDFPPCLVVFWLCPAFPRRRAGTHAYSAPLWHALQAILAFSCCYCGCFWLINLSSSESWFRPPTAFCFTSRATGSSDVPPPLVVYSSLRSSWRGIFRIGSRWSNGLVSGHPIHER